MFTLSIVTNHLTDGSKTYDVCGFNGTDSVIIYCAGNEKDAMEFQATLEKAINGHAAFVIAAQEEAVAEYEAAEGAAMNAAEGRWIDAGCTDGWANR
jgi:hypothetical protein